MGGGSFTTPRAGTAQDIRFTRSKDNTRPVRHRAGLARQLADDHDAELEPDQPQHR